MVKSVEKFRAKHQRLGFQFTHRNWELPLDAGIPENLAGTELRIPSDRSEPGSRDQEMEGVRRCRRADTGVEAVLGKRKIGARSCCKTELHPVDAIVIKGSRLIAENRTVVSAATIAVHVKPIKYGVCRAAFKCHNRGPLPAVGERFCDLVVSAIR